MPQPALKVAEYLSTPLPALREQYPPGTGGTGPRSEWPEGTLRSVQVVDDFAEQVRTYIKQFPEDPVKPHPAYKYPKFIQAITNVPSVIKSPSDLQKALSTLPLAAVSSVLTALDADPADLTQQPAKALDEAGHESDGGEEPEVPSSKPGKTKPWSFRFNKSPLGSGEFYLLREGSEKVHLVVRTINSSAFTAHDWDEYVVSGKYNYNTKSKASWYWSRAWGASKRLDCHYYILTDWKRWVFGKFDQGREHGWVSPIQSFDTTEPAILQSLFFWSKSAIGEDTGFKAAKQDPSSAEDLFPDNPARRVSTADQKSKGVSDNKVKAANESDIEESDAE